MGRPFDDITLYTPTPHLVGSAGYWEQTALENFICDLYVRNMHGYKPPKVSRITIQPSFHNIWNRSWHDGSIVSIAPYYNYDEYAALDKHGKYLYVLNLIQTSTIKLSEEYNWDRTVFESAYKQVIDCNFVFSIEYPVKKSPNRKSSAGMRLQKTESTTSVYADIKRESSSLQIKLFDKKNSWCYDCVYFLIRYNKWLNNNTYGIFYPKRGIEITYSVDSNIIELCEEGRHVTDINFQKYFMFG